MLVHEDPRRTHLFIMHTLPPTNKGRSGLEKLDGDSSAFHFRLTLFISSGEYTIPAPDSFRSLWLQYDHLPNGVPSVECLHQHATALPSRQKLNQIIIAFHAYYFALDGVGNDRTPLAAPVTFDRPKTQYESIRDADSGIVCFRENDGPCGLPEFIVDEPEMGVSIGRAFMIISS